MATKGSVKVIPLGGVGEIGKNMFVFEQGDDLLVIDAGVMFPEDEMLGIDLVIPDFTYVRERRDKVRGLLLTHGHEDHIGAVPYLLKEVNVPVYGTRLTLALLEAKLKEAGLLGQTDLRCVKAGDSFKVGPFGVDLIHVNHSIADVVGIALDTAAGTFVYVSDFKFDQTPIDGKVTDYHKLAELGKRGVTALFSDSTNAERSGYTLSEKVVGEAFNDIFRKAKGRILVATFSSNIHRIQQVIDAGVRLGRRVAVTGRSMETVVGIATELGYLRIPKGVGISLSEIERLPADKVVIITTGSQGEPMSALSRMAAAEHRSVEIMPGDTVVISASPIPGNEKMVGRTINRLFKQGANVIYHAVSGVHASGHASQEELKLMLNLCRPRYFVPVHGEYRMLVKHAGLAKEVGIPDENIFICGPGDTLEFNGREARVRQRVAAGHVFVDGLGVGDVGNVVLRDRHQLAEDGIIIVIVALDSETGEAAVDPEIVTRGFIYVRESEDLLEEARIQVKQEIHKCAASGIADWDVIKKRIRDALGSFLYENTRRRPMILPVVIDV